MKLYQRLRNWLRDAIGIKNPAKVWDSDSVGEWLLEDETKGMEE